jgi:hypothetical protein
MDDNKNKLDERFPSNSILDHKKKPEERTITKIAQGTVVKKKKGLGEKFAEVFLAADLSSVVHHILFDVLIPETKETLFEILKGSASMMLWGDKTGKYTERSHGKSTVYTSYDRYYNDRNRRGDGPREREDEQSQIPQVRRPVEQILFKTRSDAETVLHSLLRDIDQYGVVSVKDLYGYADIRTDYTKERYGWYSLPPEEAYVDRIRDGFLLVLPRPVVID